MKREKGMLDVRAYFIFGLMVLLSAVTPVLAATAGACSGSAESRAFDYWLGDWNVTQPGGPSGAVGATSKVYLDLDQCLLVESWDGGKGHSGKNMFAYSADDKSWHGMFADNEGRVHVFEGKVAGGSAEFHGPSRGPNGELVLNRIKVLRVAPSEVRQTWEQSKDDGATWAQVFQGEYSRSKK